MNQANRSFRRLDFGSCQIRVLRVNDAPASFPSSHMETPEQATPSGKSTSQPPHGSPRTRNASQPLLNVCYAVGWNLVSLGTLTESIAHASAAVAANAYDTTRGHPDRRLDFQNIGRNRKKTVKPLE
jgi:hypothetical protein